MHLFILALASVFAIFTGGLLYLAEMMKDTTADTRNIVAGIVLFAAGACGIVISFCWGCKLIVEAL